MTTILDQKTDRANKGWSVDPSGRIFGGQDNSPIFVRTAQAHNDRIDEPIRREKEEFDRMIAESIVETKPFLSAQVVPMHAEKTPGEFLSRIFSSIKKFFKEI